MGEAQTARIIDWGDSKSAATTPSDSGPSFRRWLLDNVPPDVARSFNETQLAAIEQAIESRGRRHPPVDIRLSLPFIWRRFFFVFLAGPEEEPVVWDYPTKPGESHGARSSRDSPGLGPAQK